ncbi:hypothetical protein [Planobispora longispora]|uniref:Uncharacterized protein n=1 Tax=Planobispora longispora TaxID=28887 RepID=A0A8J3RMW9_9ACTN|nr:hypothetical protein [Planobispora longispora]BFE82838.1 hypothetical protein GCM10020093_054390 [Planobispora longispora]GIH78577.1 hypothetical protein Plo01_50060 [Planobispora longispora]
MTNRAFDLSPYAGRRVEISIGYVTDPATGEVGAFVDDTRITTTGGTPGAVRRPAPRRVPRNPGRFD